MTEKQAKARAKQIFDSLTETQKNHIQSIYNDFEYWRRRGNEAKQAYMSDFITIRDFLTAGEPLEVWEAFRGLLFDYVHERYNQEQKRIDDMLLNK